MLLLRIMDSFALSDADATCCRRRCQYLRTTSMMKEDDSKDHFSPIKVLCSLNFQSWDNIVLLLYYYTTTTTFVNPLHIVYSTFILLLIVLARRRDLWRD